MEKLIKYIFVFLLLSGNLAFAQKGYYVDKDHRILKFQKEIIKFLIQEKQISVEKLPIKVADYSGKIFINKCVDIFRGKANNILLIQFGSLADHTDKYWGLLSNKKEFLFYDMADPEFLKLIKINDPVIVATITAYIKESTLDQ
ncbi:hypothetical protein [Pedobacter gandavensis]|uniref:hypothetical protein n=1 Tax=Pedobacter gandavensis TaxID=2679963 RepID=UPI002930EA8A|nr:hypothetical protein [Pedobacter gandavensis]